MPTGHDRETRPGHLAKQSLQKEIQRAIAFAAYNHLYRSGELMNMEISKQGERMLELFHGNPSRDVTPPSGASSFVQLALKGEGQFSGLWDRKEIVDIANDGNGSTSRTDLFLRPCLSRDKAFTLRAGEAFNRRSLSCAMGTQTHPVRDKTLLKFVRDEVLHHACIAIVHAINFLTPEGTLPTDKTVSDYEEYVLKNVYAELYPGQKLSNCPKSWFFPGWMPFRIYGPVVDDDMKEYQSEIFTSSYLNETMKKKKKYSKTNASPPAPQPTPRIGTENAMQFQLSGNNDDQDEDDIFADAQTNNDDEEFQGQGTHNVAMARIGRYQLPSRSTLPSRTSASSLSHPAIGTVPPPTITMDQVSVMTALCKQQAMLHSEEREAERQHQVRILQQLQDQLNTQVQVALVVAKDQPDHVLWKRILDQEEQLGQHRKAMVDAIEQHNKEKQQDKELVQSCLESITRAVPSSQAATSIASLSTSTVAATNTTTIDDLAATTTERLTPQKRRYAN